MIEVTLIHRRYQSNIHMISRNKLISTRPLTVINAFPSLTRIMYEPKTTSSLPFHQIALALYTWLPLPHTSIRELHSIELAIVCHVLLISNLGLCFVWLTADLGRCWGHSILGIYTTAPMRSSSSSSHRNPRVLIMGRCSTMIGMALAMIMMLIIMFTMDQATIGVHASHIEAGLTVIGGGGSRSW